MNREDKIVNIRLENIVPNRSQPRLNFNEEELNKLSASIKVHGVIQPIVVRKVNDKYEIVAGERRYRASSIAGMKTIPAVIVNVSDSQSKEIAIVENIQRKNLSAIEEARSYQNILNTEKITQEELARRMGLTQSTIANKLRLLNLNEIVQNALATNQISERHARSLLAITNPNMQITMLNRIISEKLTVKQTDEEIAKILGKKPEVVTNITPEPVIAEIEIAELDETPKVTPTPSAPQNVSTLDPQTQVQQNVEPTSTEKPVNQEPVSPTPQETPTEEPNKVEVKEEKPVEVPPAEEPKKPINFNSTDKSPFDVDIDKEKEKATDIIKQHKPSDIDMLMRKEGEAPTPVRTKDDKISLEDTVANVDMGSIVPEMAVNPFQDTSSPDSFDIPTNPTILEHPDFESPNTIYTSNNPIINEFMGLKEDAEPEILEASDIKNLSLAIKIARTEAKKIENLGFTVETEEFDFEDMYQVIIKIIKD